MLTAHTKHSDQIIAQDPFLTNNCYNAFQQRPDFREARILVQALEIVVSR